MTRPVGTRPGGSKKSAPASGEKRADHGLEKCRYPSVAAPREKVQFIFYFFRGRRLGDNRYFITYRPINYLPAEAGMGVKAPAVLGSAASTAR